MITIRRPRTGEIIGGQYADRVHPREDGAGRCHTCAVGYLAIQTGVRGLTSLNEVGGSVDDTMEAEVARVAGVPWQVVQRLRFDNDREGGIEINPNTTRRITYTASGDGEAFEGRGFWTVGHSALDQFVESAPGLQWAEEA